jgi:hypothetical protein
MIAKVLRCRSFLVCALLLPLAFATWAQHRVIKFSDLAAADSGAPFVAQDDASFQRIFRAMREVVEIEDARTAQRERNREQMASSPSVDVGAKKKENSQVNSSKGSAKTSTWKFQCKVYCKSPEGQTFVEVQAESASHAAAQVDRQGHGLCSSAGFGRASSSTMSAAQCSRK